MSNTDRTYFDAQMARIDDFTSKAEIAAILDDVSRHYAQDQPGDDAELRHERAVLREMLKAEALTRPT